jgi:hypothetical protein
MNDLNTVTAAEVVSALAAEKVNLAAALKTEHDQKQRARADANHWRKEARDLHEQIGRIGKGLADLYTLALRESEKNPGEARFASRVQTAKSALGIFSAVTEGLDLEIANGGDDRE